MDDGFAELRVLLVYENKKVAGLIRLALSALGMSDIIDAASAAEALRQVTSKEPDVVILDVLVDGGDGFSLVRALRDVSISPNPYMPIVVASGHGEESTIKAAINAGVHEFVRLPLSPKMLAQRIYSAVFIGRPMIDVRSYFGPDRRRYADPFYEGPERRAESEREASRRMSKRAAAEKKFAERLK